MLPSTDISRDTATICEKILPMVGLDVSELQNILSECIMLMSEYPYADYGYIKIFCEINIVENNLVKEKNDRLGGGSVGSKAKTLTNIERHRDLMRALSTDYGEELPEHHWYWGSRNEWKHSKMGQVDDISGEYRGEVFCDRAMSNFEMWYELGVCPVCNSAKTEKSDGVNMIGICLSCDSRCDYDKNHRYYDDVPEIKRPAKISTEVSLLLYAKKVGLV